MNELLFKRIDGARDIPCKPWPQKFYISRYMVDSYNCEIRRLTFMGIIKGIFTNFISMSYWRFMHLLFKIGFLDTPEGNILSFGDWRWKFWKVKKERRKKGDYER